MGVLPPLTARENGAPWATLVRAASAISAAASPAALAASRTTSSSMSPVTDPEEGSTGPPPESRLRLLDLEADQLLERVAQGLVPAITQVPAHTALDPGDHPPGLRDVPAAMGRQADDLRPGIVWVGDPTHVASLLEIVHHEHHPLLRHPGPVREVGEARARSPIDVEHHRGVAGAGVRIPTLVERGDELGPERAMRLQEQAAKIHVPHDRHHATACVLRPCGRPFTFGYPRAVTLEIREARPDEYAEAGAVTAMAYREFVRQGDTGWEEYLQRIADVEGRAGRTTIFVAVDGERILGTATLELDGRVEPEDDPTLAPDEAHIRMLGVHPDARRRGIALALMDACFARARGAGKSRMTLHTTERMRSARAMYEGLGFRRLPDRVFPDGFVLLTYEKPIG